MYKKIQKPKLKWGKDINRKFTKEDIQMSKKHNVKVYTCILKNQTTSPNKTKKQKTQA